MNSCTKKIVISFLSFAACIFYNKQSNAQVTCGFDELRTKMLQTDPVFRNQQESFERLWQQVQTSGKVAHRTIIEGTDTLYEIPVVVHVIHTGGAIGSNYNPADTTIQNAVMRLNQVYGATYPGNPGPGAGGVNVRIRFALAQRDSVCNPTTGINRVDGVTALGGASGTTFGNSGVRAQTASGISDTLLKSIIRWPNGSYFNVWIVPEIDNWDGYVAGSGVLGYANLPGAVFYLDGAVFTASQLAAGTKTFAHEIGHAFNLLHPFAGGCNTTNCATTGDMICDTDPYASAMFNCPGGNNPCTGTSWVPAVNNIMGYFSCTDRFTQGQADRMMLAAFNMRGSLFQSLGAIAPGAQASQPSPAVAACSTPGSANANNTFDVGPRSITIGDLQSFSQGYTNDGNLSYIDRTQSTCQQAGVAPAHLQKGQSYSLSVGTGNNPENVRIYIDYNNDGAFNGAGELVFSGNGPAGQSFYTHTGTFIVPNQAAVVENTYVRMRVVSDITANPQPCAATLQYGQVEDFAVIINQVVLPVTLKLFSAKVVPGKQAVQLHWETADETAFSHYEIERSKDGAAFSRMGSIAAKGSNSSYDLEDGSPFTAMNYYRLKMLNKDGKYSYSPVRTAVLTAPAVAFTLYPNPAKKWITATIPVSGRYAYTVVNTIGQQVMTGSNEDLKQGEKLELDIRAAGLAQGIYYLQLANQTGDQYRATFIVE